MNKKSQPNAALFDWRLEILVEYWTNSSSTFDELLQLSRGDLCPAKTCWQVLEQRHL
jgi:hypothetical protein